MKSYTDLEQSKILAKILKLESADMCYVAGALLVKAPTTYGIVPVEEMYKRHIIPCWSLAALLSVLPKLINHETLFIETSAALWHIGYRNIYTARGDNLVDACIAIIEKLHEFNLL